MYSNRRFYSIDSPTYVFQSAISKPNKINSNLNFCDFGLLYFRLKLIQPITSLYYVLANNVSCLIECYLKIKFHFPYWALFFLFPTTILTSLSFVNLCDKNFGLVILLFIRKKPISFVKGKKEIKSKTQFSYNFLIFYQNLT